MAYAGLTPLFYEKIAHEGGEQKHDVVRYNYSDPDSVKAFCTRKVFKKGALRVDDSRTLSAAGETVDMLTSFYYMRKLPFQSWTPVYCKAEYLFRKTERNTQHTVRRLAELEIDGKCVPTYHITFIFTSKGGQKSSDDMEAWISADSKRIPMRLEGKLPVGKVHCILTGSE